MKRYIIGCAAVVVVVAVILAGAHHGPQISSSKTLEVVAAENFWGSIASQIGGNRVQVKSIVSDPNADPHEYETSSADARAVATANYVIVNGAGYDSWADKLISASPNPQRKVLTVASLIGKKEGDNPHFWYNPTYVNQVAAQVKTDLSALDPSESQYFQQNYRSLMNSLATYQNRIAEIKHAYGGTQVAATEDIFAYLATAAGLNLVSPPSFTAAVAEGNDPPAGSIVQFEQQLRSGQIKVLVYNEQTVTPLTNTMKQLAAQQNIPIVGVTETIQPPDTSFQVWMNAELINLQNALNAPALGQ